MHAFEKIRGIGPQTAKNLVEHGFADVGTIAGASVADLAAVPGFSVARAEQTIAAAKALTGAAPEERAGQSSREEAESETTPHEDKGEEPGGKKGPEGKKPGKSGKGRKGKKEKKEVKGKKEKKSGKGKKKKKK